MKRSSKYVCAALTLVGIACSVQAQTDVTFTNAAGGVWSNAGNWTPAQVPNNGGGFTFNATLGPLGVGYTVSQDLPVTLENFTISDTLATLNVGTETLTVNQGFTADVGTIMTTGVGGLVAVAGQTVFGDVVLAGAGQFQASGNLSIAPLTLMEICDTDVDYGGVGPAAATWQGNNTMLLNLSGTFNNSTGSLLQISPDGNKQVAGDGTGLLTNLGEMVLLASPPPPVMDGQGKVATGIGLTPRGAAIAINDVFSVVGAGFVNDGGVTVLRGDLNLVGVVNNLTTNGVLGLGRWTLQTPAAGGGAARILFPQRDAVTNINTRVTLLGEGTQFPAIDGVSTIGPAGRFEIGQFRNFTAQTPLTVLGEIVVGQNSIFDVSAGMTNLTGGQLTGGAFAVSGTLSTPNFSSIFALNQSRVRLIGTASQFPAIATLQVVGPGAMFSIENGRGFSTQSALLIQPTGLLRIGASSQMVVTGQLLNNNNGAFTGGDFEIRGSLGGGIGQITSLVNSRVAMFGAASQITDASGTDALGSLQFIDATSTLEVRNGKTLVVSSPITVDGTIRIDPASSVNPPPGTGNLGSTELETTSTLTVNAGSTIEIGITSTAVGDVGLLRAASVVFTGGNAGKLIVRFDPGVVLPDPFVIHVVRSPSVTGKFASLSLVGLDATHNLTTVYDGLTGVQIRIDRVCPADINGDGIIDNGDIGAFVAFFLAGNLGADFNSDGILDNGDISAFVAAFLAGC